MANIAVIALRDANSRNSRLSTIKLVDITSPVTHRRSNSPAAKISSADKCLEDGHKKDGDEEAEKEEHQLMWKCFV